MYEVASARNRHGDPVVEAQDGSGTKPGTRQRGGERPVRHVGGEGS